MRFLTPVLFAAAAVYVGWFNGTHTDRTLVLPMLDLLDPSIASNPAAQGALTVKVLGGLAVVLALWEGVAFFRHRAAAPPPS
jgi:hypothetical protein